MITVNQPDRDNDSIDPNTIQQAMWRGIRDALRRHMLLGESIAVADESTDGGVKILGPEEIRKLLEAA